MVKAGLDGSEEGRGNIGNGVETMRDGGRAPVTSIADICMRREIGLREVESSVQSVICSSVPKNGSKGEVGPGESHYFLITKVPFSFVPSSYCLQLQHCSSGVTFQANR